MEKYGFIYIWYDRKRKMYYIGCRWGTEDDGYICSSNRMRDAYRRRPQDFKRKIISRGIDREKLLDEEYKWLSLIPEHELGKKYYNLRKHKWGHWSTDKNSRLTIRQKISEALLKPETRKRLSEANRGRKHTKESREKIREARAKQIYTEETCRKISESHKGEKNHFFGKKHSEETKRKMSEAAKKRKDNRKHTEETKKKMSVIAKQRPPDHPSNLNLKAYNNA